MNRPTIIVESNDLEMLLTSQNGAFGQFAETDRRRNAVLKLALRGYNLSRLHDEEKQAEIVKIG